MRIPLIVLTPRNKYFESNAIKHKYTIPPSSGFLSMYAVALTALI